MQLLMFFFVTSSKKSKYFWIFLFFYLCLKILRSKTSNGSLCFWQRYLSKSFRVTIAICYIWISNTCTYILIYWCTFLGELVIHLYSSTSHWGIPYNQSASVNSDIENHLFDVFLFNMLSNLPRHDWYLHSIQYQTSLLEKFSVLENLLLST